MKRPLGEYQKNMIDGVLYGKYAVKRPIDKQTIRCLNSLVKRGLVHMSFTFALTIIVIGDFGLER
jgi:hypothetical protein